MRTDCGTMLCLSTRCKRAKKCACNVCGELKAINPNLYDSCVDACQQVPRPTAADQYLCEEVSPEILFNRYGIIKCGFDPYDTLEGQLFTQQKEEQEQSTAFQQRIILGLGAFLLLLVLLFIFD